MVEAGDGDVERGRVEGDVEGRVEDGDEDVKPWRRWSSRLSAASKAAGRSRAASKATAVSRAKSRATAMAAWKSMATAAAAVPDMKSTTPKRDSGLRGPRVRRREKRVAVERKDR